MPFRYTPPLQGPRLYTPPVGHSQYPLRWKPAARSWMPSLFSGKPHALALPSSVSAVTLSIDHQGQPQTSTSYAYATEDAFAQACDAPSFRVDFPLPLVHDAAGQATDVIAWNQVNVQWTMSAPARWVHFWICPRGGVPEHWAKDLASLLVLDDDAIQNDGLHFDIPADQLVPNTVDPRWLEAPFLLLISAEEATAGNADNPQVDDVPPINDAAWTYFDVASAWDVNAVTYVKDAPTLLLGDDAAALGAVGAVGARRTGNDDRGAPYTLSDERQLALARKIYDAKHGPGESAHQPDHMLKGHLDFNSVSAICRWQNEQAYQVVASWASVTVLKRQANGAYTLDALYANGTTRTCYLFDQQHDVFHHLTPDTFQPGHAPGVTAVAPFPNTEHGFHYNGSGGPHPSKDHWKMYRFADTVFPVDFAVTPGISSCAGGVTFPAQATPDWLVLWHIDASPTIPLKAILEDLQQRDAGLQNLGFRTIAVVFPEPGELHKYRASNIYPDAARAASQTVWLPRGAHLYSGTTTVGCGQDVLGLDLSGGAPGLFWTYDFDKRTPMWPQAGRRDEATWLADLLVDFNDDIFGTYRFNGNAITTTDDLKPYVAATSPAQGLSDMTRQVQTDRKAGARFVRLDPVGTALFGQIAQAATAFEDQDCFLVGEKGQRELSHYDAAAQFTVPTAAANDAP